MNEHGVCIDCGAHTPLRLPRRFPHICTDCLFPPPPPNGSESQEQDLGDPTFGKRPSMVEMLYQRAQTAPFYKRFGGDHHRRSNDDRLGGGNV